MTEVRFSAEVSQADLDAALNFIRKRVRRHGEDPLTGIGAALYSVIFVASDGLIACGVSASEVARIIDQTTAQVSFHLQSAPTDATAA